MTPNRADLPKLGMWKSAKKRTTQAVAERSFKKFIMEPSREKIDLRAGPVEIGCRNIIMSRYYHTIG
jgi:hypothetical protein